MRYWFLQNWNTEMWKRHFPYLYKDFWITFKLVAIVVSTGRIHPRVSSWYGAWPSSSPNPIFVVETFSGHTLYHWHFRVSPRARSLLSPSWPLIGRALHSVLWLVKSVLIIPLLYPLAPPVLLCRSEKAWRWGLQFNKKMRWKLN